MLEINLKLKLKVRNQIFILNYFIDKILNLNGKRIRINPNELNKHFSTTSKRLA